MESKHRYVLLSVGLCVILIFGYMQSENLVTGTRFQLYQVLQDTFNIRLVTNYEVQTLSTERNVSYSDRPFSSKNVENSANQGIISRCPNHNSDNWSFNCTLPCQTAPNPIVGVLAHSQIYIECNQTPPIANFTFKKNANKVQTFPAHSECLYDFIVQQCYDGKPVPNIVHYMWFSKREMNFYHLLSFLSASKMLRPCLILIHGNFQPYGKYWNYLLTVVSNIIHVSREPPETIYGKPLANVEHKADVGRIQALQRFGGIYMDTDEIILRNLEPLRVYPFTLSHAVDDNLSNGLILSAKGAEFLNLWISEYRTYTKDQWAYHSTIVPNILSKKYPHLIHVENKTFVRPNYTQLQLLFKMNFDWSKNYAIHLYIRFYKLEHNFEDIRTLNTTIGSVARYIIYGSKELCDK